MLPTVFPAVDWSTVFRMGLGADASVDARLERARGILEARYEEPWRVTDLARRVGLSREAFIRGFRGAYGETPHQYLIDRRIRAARRMLEGGDASVTEVCFAVGFSSLGTFSATFRRRTGQPPSAWRRASVLVRPPWAQLLPFVPGCFAWRVAGVDPSLFEKPGGTARD